MRKILILFAVFTTLVLGVKAQGNCNWMIEPLIDGNPVGGAPYNLTETDFTWSMHLLGKESCVRDASFVDASAYWESALAPQLLVGFDLVTFASCPGGWAPGMELVFTFTINKPGSPYDGFSGSRTYRLTNASEMAMGAPSENAPNTELSGINMKGAPKPEITVDGITICAGVTGATLRAVIDNAPAAGYSIDWRNPAWGAATDLGGATGDNIEVTGNITATGIYHAILKDAGGVALDTADFTITVNQNPNATAGLAAGGKKDICKDDKVNLTSGPNGPGYSYAWTGGAGNVQNPANVTVSATGDTKFVVTVTETATGCKDTASVTVTAHSVTVADATKSTPTGTSTSVNASPTFDPSGKEGTAAEIKYEWTPADKINGAATGSSITTVALTADQDYTVKVTDKHGCSDEGKKTVQVTGDALAVNPQNAEGCSGTEFELDSKITGGTTPYTVTWSNLGALVLDNVNARKPKVKNTTPAGVYAGVTVTVTDANNGTPIVKTITVTVGVTPQLSNINATNLTTAVNTSNLSVTVAPTAGVTCTWTPAASINGNNTGTSVTTKALSDPIPEFTVTATNADGKCPATEKVTPVRLGDALSATITAPDNICADAANFTVSVTPRGGTGGPYTYLWAAPGVTFDNATVQSPKVTNGATLSGNIEFTVDVSDGDTTIQRKKTITVNELIAATVSTTCTSSTRFNGIVTVSKGTAPFVIYSNAAGTTPVTGVTWAGNVGTIPNLASGTTYNYYIKDANGCNLLALNPMSADCSCGAELALSIPVAVPCAGPDAEVKITMTATGGTSYSFQLTTPDGALVKNVVDEAGPTWDFIVQYGVHPSGEYQVRGFTAKTVANPAGCDGNVRGLPDVKFNPVPVFNAQNDVTDACAGDIMTLRTLGNPSNNTTFEWTGTGIEPNGKLTAVVGTNTYTVTGTNRYGCSATDMVDVTVHPRPDVEIPGGGAEVCQGDPVTLTATGAATYVWRPANVVNGVAFTPTTTGRYSVTGTNNEGCSDTASVMVIVNNPPVITDQSIDRTIAIGRDVWFSVTAVGQNLSYVWERESNGVWVQLADANGSIPKISGATTNRITFTGVPESWNGSKFRCIVTGACGDDMAEFNLNVKECFEIQDVLLEMGEGIRPDEIPGDAIDGWYCIGTKIALHASILLEDGEVMQNPRYKWSIDGLRVTYTDSSVLSWVPQYWEDDIVVKVSAYCDGACDTVASKWIRLKAKPFEDIKLGIRTSIDPERSFCPGQVIDFSVYGKGLGEHPQYQWYNDIFDKGISETLTLTMKQKDTWVKVVITPSSEVCAAESSYTDTVFLSVKPDAKPKLHIENSINDTIACRGDKISLMAIYEGAGMNPLITWQRDVWNLGTGQFASIILDGKEKDVWIKCSLYPGNNVCYTGDTLVDYMKIKILEDVGTVAITSDLEEGKRPGDEITFKATTENIIGNNYYEWFVNAMLTNEPTDTYISTILRQGDRVTCAVSGSRICQARVFSNEIVVDFNRASRDTLVEIHKGEIVRNLNMAKIGDENNTFMLQELPKWGTAVMTYDGVFTYYPVREFVGSDYVKYIVRDRYNKDKFEEGYIYIRVLSNERYFIPNIITPNGDGQNDTWVLNFLKDYPNHLITVYNRSGRVVFQTKNYQNDWNGQGLSPSGYVAHINLPNGIYTYVIDLGNKEIIKSWIEIRSDIYRKGNR